LYEEAEPAFIVVLALFLFIEMLYTVKSTLAPNHQETNFSSQTALDSLIAG
jgi:hypothetical protein